MTDGHPREAESWEWDEDNESELAAHAISVDEVEQVWAEGPEWVRNKKHRAGDYKMLGADVRRAVADYRCAVQPRPAK